MLISFYFSCHPELWFSDLSPCKAVVLLPRQQQDIEGFEPRSVSSHKPLLQPLISTPDTAPSALHFLQVRPDFQKVSFLTAQSFLHVILSQQGAARPAPFPWDGPGGPPARGSWDHGCLTPSHGAGMSLQRGGWEPQLCSPRGWLLAPPAHCSVLAGTN